MGMVALAAYAIYRYIKPMVDSDNTEQERLEIRIDETTLIATIALIIAITALYKTLNQ